MPTFEFASLEFPLVEALQLAASVVPKAKHKFDELLWYTHKVSYSTVGGGDAKDGQSTEHLRSAHAIVSELRECKAHESKSTSVMVDGGPNGPEYIVPAGSYTLYDPKLGRVCIR